MIRKYWESIHQYWQLRSLRTKLLVPIVGLVLISLIGSTFAFAVGTARTQDQLLEQQISADAQRIEDAFKARSRTVRDSARLLARDPLISEALRFDTAESLEALNSRAMVVRERFNLGLVQIYNDDGELRANLALSSLYEVSSLLPLANTEEAVIRLANKRQLLLSRARLQNGLGYVVTGVDLEAELQRIVAQNRLTSDVGMEVDGIHLETDSGLRFDLPEGRSGDLYSRKSQIHLGDTRITLLLARKITEIRRTTEAGLMVMVSSTLLTTVLLLLMGILISRSITQPVQRLASAAETIAKGDLRRQLGEMARAEPFAVGSQDEIGMLARAFNEMLCELIDLYADLENKVQQRTEELHQRALQLETSIAVGQRITSLLELDPLLNEVAGLIQARFGYYYVGIFLLEGESVHLAARAGAPEVADRWLAEDFSLEVVHDPALRQAIRERRSVRIDDIREAGDHTHLALAPKTRSELILPLEIGGSVLGVLDLHSDRVAGFENDNVPLLQSLADQVTIAIQNASRYQGERVRRQLAETLYEIGRALSGTLDLHEVLSLILANLAEIVPYDRGSVLLRRDGELEMVSARGFPEDAQPDRLRIPIKAGDVFHDVCQNREPVAIADVAVDRPDWQQVENLPQTRAWLGVPLIRRDEVVGMLSLARETPHPYSEEEITLATTFAGQAAMALENARLYDEITRFNQQLEAKVQERTEALQGAYAKLERLDRTKTSFITVVSHELRTPLTIVSGYSQMVMQDRLIRENPYLEQLSTGIYGGLTRMHEIINSMLDMAKVDSRALRLSPEPLSLHRLLRMLTRNFESAVKERDLTLTLEDFSQLPPVQADSDALRKVFSQLIVNAIKYTPDGGAIRIHGCFYAPGSGHPYAGEVGAVEVVISDTGIGIDPEAQSLIFVKFYQTGEVALHSTGKTKFKGGGPGLGLPIALGIVEAHHGRLWVESPGYDEVRCPGSQFHVLLPLEYRPDSQQPLG